MLLSNLPQESNSNIISTTIILTQAWVFIITLQTVFKQSPYSNEN